MDIGICEHTKERIKSSDWKHRDIVENAKYTVGLDIDEELVAYIQKQCPNYNLTVCDATSDTFLGEKFDIVRVGDVIEHVDNPVAMLKFCKRHLKKDGKIIVRTPNGYHFNYYYLANLNGTDNSNMEHVNYTFPTHALEISRRSDLNLKRYLTQYKNGFSIKGLKIAVYLLLKLKLRHSIAELFYKPEKYSTIYVYEFTH